VATLSTAYKIRSSEAILPETLPAPAPIVKWVGGKTGLLGQLVPLLPKGVELMRHVEPFVGGGAMFFRLRPERALLCDINESLIASYETIRDHVEEVVPFLNRLARRHSEQNYYAVRSRYNSATNCSLVERTAMFIYLNKTCFNGLHRVNQKGEFNVPAGRYNNPRIFDIDALRAASRQLLSAELRKQSFEGLLATAKPGDFVYFDPPYEPVSSTANFTSYTRNGFSQEDQIRLRDVFVELDRRKCHLMLSNSDVPFIRNLYKAFRVDKVAALRAINCDGRNRGRVSELVVRNYS
jgi:DNA adenine methylase